jgi:hypothetical protein
MRFVMYVFAKGSYPGRQPAPQADYPLIDNPFAPEILASGIAGISEINGVIMLALESARYDHAQPTPVLERVVVARVALSVSAAQLLVVELNSFLEQNGVSPSKAAAQGAAFQ